MKAQTSGRPRAMLLLASMCLLSTCPASAEEVATTAERASTTKVLAPQHASQSGPKSEGLSAANTKKSPCAAVKALPASVHKHAPSSYKHHFFGKADFYSSALNGHPTASGAPYDENKLTAAHRKLPFGTKVTVVNRTNGKTCTLTINDRGPFTANRVIDVSKAAAKELGLMNDKNRMVDCFIRIESSDFLKPRQVAGREAPGSL